MIIFYHVIRSWDSSLLKHPSLEPSNLPIPVIPRDVLSDLFAFCDEKTISSISRVCKLWNEMTKEETFLKKRIQNILSNAIPGSFLIDEKKALKEQYSDLKIQIRKKEDLKKKNWVNKIVDRLLPSKKRNEREFTASVTSENFTFVIEINNDKREMFEYYEYEEYLAKKQSLLREGYTEAP